MKKILVGVLLGALLLAMAACTEAQTPDTTVQEPDVTLPVKELVDPRGTVLENTSTGERDPQLVETKYETDDVVIADFIPTKMGYALDPTGKTDSTEGLQKALDDCYKLGGGTVYLPAGNYAISDNIYIPPYVTLRGDWQDPDQGKEYGTIISVWMESDDCISEGIFQMGGSSGAVGLTVYYPLQTLDLVRPYPWTFYVRGVESESMLYTIKNVTVINGYRGIGTNRKFPHECLIVENVKGTFLNCGMELNYSTDFSLVQGYTVNNKYWAEASADCMNAEPLSRIDAFTKQYTTGLQASDEDWTLFSDISIDGCAIGVHTVNGARMMQTVSYSGGFHELTVTDCVKGVVFDSLDPHWGTVIANSTIEGGLYNNTKHVVKMANVQVIGEVYVKEGGKNVVEETDLSQYVADYDRTYRKPKANVKVLNITAGYAGDAAAEVQAALDEVGQAGGGVVYIPSGMYHFRSPIKVPAGVELRGSSPVAVRDAREDGGTVFLCYYGDDAEHGAEDQAFITLDGDYAGLSGIRVWYPENSPLSEDINTTYAVRGTGTGVYVVHCDLVAAAYGVDFRNCDEHYVAENNTCIYYNTYYLGGKNGMLTKCIQNPSMLTRTHNPFLVDWSLMSNSSTVLTEEILRPNTRYVIFENAENQQMCLTMCYGPKRFITNINSVNTLLCNIGSDAILPSEYQISVDGGNVVGINVLRLGGFSYELISGKVELFNRIAHNEVGEVTAIEEK